MLMLLLLYVIVGDDAAALHVSSFVATQITGNGFFDIVIDLKYFVPHKLLILISGIAKFLRNINHFNWFD